ncbi:hypothetical protein RB600_002799 [Gaeumannomyces tritici]
MASATVIPAGGTFVDTLKKSFVDVPVDKEKDNAIDTAAFLDAAESLTTIFDLLGSVAFTPVKNDMLGNVKVRIASVSLLPGLPGHCQAQRANRVPGISTIQKIRDRLLAAPAESETIQELVLNELKTKKHVATEGLLWLIRGLEFVCIALSQNLAQATTELADSFRTAYSETLKPHHSFIVKPVFSAAMSAVPYRKDFYAKVGSDEEKVKADLGEYLASLDKIVGILKGFLDRKEAKW